MDQSEEEGLPVRKKMKKWETNISDLPVEVLETIFQDYLPQLTDEELITFHTLGIRFAKVACRILPKRKLSFNGCYALKPEDLLRALSFHNEPLSVDIDHCYWFTDSVISRLVTSVPLQELRIINFDLSCDDVTKLFKLELNKLSMKWTSEWASACQVTKDRSGPFWTTLKLVKVFFNQDKSISEFPEHFLHHCPNLISLTVTKNKVEINKARSGYIFRDLDPQLSFQHPNAVNVSDVLKSVKATGDAEIIYRFWPKEKFSMLKASIVQSKKGTIRAPECLYKHITESKYCSKTNNVWVLMPIYNCSENFWEIAEYMLQKYNRTTRKYAYDGLDLQNCDKLERFPTGLTLLTSQMTHMSYLDISMPSITLTDKDKELAIEGVGRLRNLKTLLMNTYFISVLEIENEKVDRLKDLSKDAIENSSMGLLTSCCKHISFLKLFGNNNANQKNEYVPESDLAAISKLENLLELHLVDILTKGSGQSLSLITKGCTKLRALQLKNINFSEKQKSMEESLLHAKSITEIHIYQKIELSEHLINNLSGCQHLERLGLEGVTASLDQLEYLTKKLLTMESLYVLRLVTKNTIKFPISLIWKLALINNSKPAFRYVLRNIEDLLNDNMKSTNKENQQIDNLIKLKWPPIHQIMFQYSCSKSNFSTRNKQICISPSKSLL